MSRDFAEADWRVLRIIRETALDRFYEEILRRVAGICSDSATTLHDRYKELWRLLKAEDEKLSLAFDNPRRSAALQQLASMCLWGVVKPEELESFTPETQSKVRFLMELNR